MGVLRPLDYGMYMQSYKRVQLRICPIYHHDQILITQVFTE